MNSPQDSTATPLSSARPICGDVIVTTLATTIRVSVSADSTARGARISNPAADIPPEIDGAALTKTAWRAMFHRKSASNQAQITEK